MRALYGSWQTVTISGLTITNGDAGICNDHGALTVSNCIVSGNSSYGGIGVNGSHGPGVERGNNRRDAQEIYGDRVLAGISLTIDNSIVSDNLGPGVFNDSATVTILNSTISGNSAGQFGDGGGIYASGFKGPPLPRLSTAQSAATQRPTRVAVSLTSMVL